MTDHELQQAARDAISDVKQKDAAEELGVSTATISRALNHDKPSRYAATLRDIVGTFTEYRIESVTMHQVKRKD